MKRYQRDLQVQLACVVQEAWQEGKWGRNLGPNRLAKQLALAQSASIRRGHLFLTGVWMPSRRVMRLDRVRFESG